MEVAEGVVEIEDVDAFVAELAAVGEDHGVAVQAFDARYVVDCEHLRRAVEMANRAWRHDDAIARERAVEILLYAAGRRQINRALEMGVGEGETAIVAVVDALDGDPDAEAAAAREVAALLDPEETLGAYDESLVREFFDVGEAELAATDGGVPDLVRERVALLAVEK